MRQPARLRAGCYLVTTQTSLHVIINIYMFNHLLRQYVLRSLYTIDLTSTEKVIADESVDEKYVPALKGALWAGASMTPAIVLLDTTVIVSVLIPATMVAGTAWFSVSLANLKKKFEPFGLELTYNLFKAFVSSLVILFLAAMFSLTQPLWGGMAAMINTHVPWAAILAALLGSFGVFGLLYQIFLGAIKYDVNDAMLTGQNEAAEKFFKKSLSLLHTTAEALRDNKSLQVANYYIGVSFFEIFNYISVVRPQLADTAITDNLAKANSLIDNPSILPQKKADVIAYQLIEAFLSLLNEQKELERHKSYTALKDEYRNLTKKNNKEDQHMIDTRLSVVFEEIATLIDEFGERLFK